MSKNNTPFYSRILFKLLTPVILTGLISSTFLVYYLSAPLKDFLLHQLDANIHFASDINMQNCEDSFSYLLDLRLERNEEMIRVMQKEVLDKIEKIREIFPQINFLVIQSGKTVRKMTSNETIDPAKIMPDLSKTGESVFIRIGKRDVRARLNYFPYWDWQIITFIYEDEYNKPVNMSYKITYLSASAVFISVIITMLAAFYLLISKPLKKLTSATGSISEGKFPMIDLTEKNEFGILVDSFNSMVTSLKNEKAEVKNLISQLSESEALFRSQFEYGNIGIAILRVSGEWVRVNNRLCKLLGYSESELTKKNWADIFDKNDLRYSRSSFDRMLRGETDSFDFDMKVYDKNARIIYSHINISCVRENGDRVKYLIASVLDITKRKAAEEARIESNRILRTVLDTIPVRVFWKDREGKYLGANQSFAEDAGFASPEELIGKTDQDMIFSGNAKFIRDDDLRIMETGMSEIQFEYPSKKPGGKTGWYLTNRVPMEDESKNVTGLLGTYHDITDQKETENQLRKLRNYLSNIIDSMPSVLIGVDPEGRITQWNKRAASETGINSENAQGQLLGDVFPRLSGEISRIKESIDQRKVKTDTRRSRLYRNNILYEDITIYPLISNGVEGAVIRVDNTTDKVLLEEMMVQSEKMLSVGGLAAGMAHEINNPLAGIIQTANVMKTRLTEIDLAPNKRAAEEVGITIESIKRFMEKRGIVRMVNTINESGMQVAEIVNNMLSFARKTDSNVSSHNPKDLIDQILKIASSDYDLKKRYDFKTIEIVKEYEKNLPLLYCEGAKIQQVLLNILRNGAQAMQENESKKDAPKFILRLINDKIKNMLRIEIEDNGPGMEESVRKRVFEPFFTTKSPGIGTGLGLSVSYFIITENHGGKMEVISKEGKGTIFIILLPFNSNGDKKSEL